MGCDIHCYSEKKVTDRNWKCLQEPEEVIYVGEIKEIQIPYFMSERCYNLFSILANVRNGYGFAGIPTGEGFNYICEPKGVPEDASDLVKGEYDKWEGDAHSASWLTLRELQEFDWNQTTILYGMVSQEEYEKLRETGGPPQGSYCSWTNDKTCKQYSWQQTYKECCDFFFEKYIPILEELADGDPDSVRIVFWFDN